MVPSPATATTCASAPATRPGVIGRIGTCFGDAGVSIQSIVQFDARDDAAEIVVITHQVREDRFREALAAIEGLQEVQTVAACLRAL